MNIKRGDLLPNESLTKKIIHKGFWLYFFWYLAAPLWYIIRVIISNSPQVSVADFWLMYSIISLITILYTYNDLWLTESLQFFLPRFYLRKEYNNIKTAIRISLSIEIITWFTISAWLWFWSNWLSIHYFHNENAEIILKYFCLYFIWTNILQIIQSIFKAFQKTFEFQFLEFMKAFSILLLTSFFFFYDGNIETYSISRIIGLWIAIITALLLYKKYRKTLMKGEFSLINFNTKEYIKYASWAFIGFWLGKLLWQIILQFVVYYLWTESAWYYSNFLSLYWIGITILRPISSLIYPLTSEYKEKSKLKEINNLINIFYNYFSIITLSFSTFLLIFWSEISTILFWQKYLISWVLLTYGWIFLVFNLLSSFNYRILAWLWKIKAKVFITWITCIITIIFAILWIKLGNLYWACIAFWFSNIINRLLSFYLIKKENYKTNLKWDFIIKNISLLILLWTIAFYIKHYIIWYIWNKLTLFLSLWAIFIIFYSIILTANMNEIKNIRKIKDKTK